MIMMFLQFFIWGAWYATGGNYMKAYGMSGVIYIVYLASPIGSIVSPFFLGMIADRFFAVEKLMGVMHLLSGLFLFSAPSFGAANPAVFLSFMFLHMLCYMPTVGLASAMVLHLAGNREKEFPVIRVFGTIGWITAGIIVSYILQGDSTSAPSMSPAPAAWYWVSIAFHFHTSRQSVPLPGFPCANYWDLMYCSNSHQLHISFFCWDCS